MIKIKMADFTDIDRITFLRVEQQIEDWNKTALSEDFLQYSERFSAITNKYLMLNLNKSIYFAVMYIDEILIAIAALEEIKKLPQITICKKSDSRLGNIVSVYTKYDYRGKGYQQKLLKVLLDFAIEQGFTDITLTTNTDDAKHIYKKFGFRYISDKYYLNLKKTV